MFRLISLILGLLLAASAVTAGIRARCAMTVHCAGCPDAQLAWKAPLHCPLIHPASPDSVAGERSTTVTFVALLVAHPLRIAQETQRIFLAPPSIAVEAPRPPGHDILRV